MSDPWARFFPEQTGAEGSPSGAPAPSATPDPWARFFPQEEPAVPKKKYEPYQGSILPISRDEEGRTHFDSNAGLLGSLKRSVTLPRDVYEGKVDPLSDEGLARTREMAATVSPATPGVRAGDYQRLLTGKPRPAAVPAPTVDALKEAGEQGYNAVRGMGVDYSSEHVGRLAGTLRQDLNDNGILQNLAPRTHDILDRLTPPAGESSVAPINGLIAARRALGHIASNRNPDAATDRGAAVRAIKALDEFLEGSDPAAVVAGPAAAAAQTFRDANANYAAHFRGSTLDRLEHRADLKAAAANSGQNVGNTIRSRLADLIDNPKASRGFTDEEIAALEQAVEGTVASNATRFGGNLLGGGGGLGMTMTSAIGAATGSQYGLPGTVAGAAAPVLGFGLKKASNALTRRQMNAVNQSTRRRSPLAQELERGAPMTAVNPEQRAALIRALLLEQEQAPDEPMRLRVSPHK